MSTSQDISALLIDQNRWWGVPGYRTVRGYPNRRDAFAHVLEYAGELRSNRAALLLGPRQVGKTTLLLQVVDDLLDRGWPPGNITFFDFSDDRLIGPISPRAIMAATPPGLNAGQRRVFLFDEIQEALSWERWLKSAVDDARRSIAPERPIFIATGSAASALADGTVESGQGRWDEIPIEGLSYGEFLRLNALMIDGVPESESEVSGRDPSVFDRYLLTGGFPEYARPESGRNALSTIRQDIIERALLRDLRRSGTEIDRVKRLFVYLATDSGSAWNADNRAQDLDANRKSVDAWLDLLERTRLVCRLEADQPANSKASARLRPRKKIYAADHGLVTAMSSLPDPLADPGIRGRVLETAVFRHLREVARTSDGHLGYFRQRDDLEIDFVFRPRRGPSVAIEVTTSSRPKGKITRLGKAAGVVGIDRRMLVYDGLIEDERAGIETIPAHRFLAQPLRYLETSR